MSAHRDLAELELLDEALVHDRPSPIPRTGGDKETRPRAIAAEIPVLMHDLRPRG